jgi:hypothetical protein
MHVSVLAGGMHACLHACGMSAWVKSWKRVDCPRQGLAASYVIVPTARQAAAAPEWKQARQAREIFTCSSRIEKSNVVAPCYGLPRFGSEAWASYTAARQQHEVLPTP